MGSRWIGGVLGLAAIAACDGGPNSGTGTAGRGGGGAGGAGGLAGRGGSAAGAGGNTAGNGGGAAGSAGSAAGSSAAGSAGSAAGGGAAGSAGSAAGSSAAGSAGSAAGSSAAGSGGVAGTNCGPAGPAGAGGSQPPPDPPQPGTWGGGDGCPGVHWLGDFDGGGRATDCAFEVAGSTPNLRGLEVFQGGGPSVPLGHFYRGPGIVTPDVLPAVHYDVGGIGLNAVDLTGDTVTDILRAYTNSPHGLVYVLLVGQGSGVFLAPTVFADTGFTPAPRGLLFSRSARGDFNNDGKTDLFLTGSVPAMSGRVYWYALTHTGGTTIAFTETDAGLSAGATGNVQPLDARDFNLDGKMDGLAFLETTETGTRAVIAVGAGDGTFANTITVPGSEGSKSVSSRDVNSDGKTDLIVVFGTATCEPRVVTLYGDGALGFSTTPP